MPRSEVWTLSKSVNTEITWLFRMTNLSSRQRGRTVTTKLHKSRQTIWSSGPRRGPTPRHTVTYKVTSLDLPMTSSSTLTRCSYPNSSETSEKIILHVTTSRRGGLKPSASTPSGFLWVTRESPSDSSRVSHTRIAQWLLSSWPWQRRNDARTALTTSQFRSNGLNSQSNTMTLRNKAARGISKLHVCLFVMILLNAQSVTPRLKVLHSVTWCEPLCCLTTAHFSELLHLLFFLRILFNVISLQVNKQKATATGLCLVSSVIPQVTGQRATQ
jgi:hypothetical protein